MYLFGGYVKLEVSNVFSEIKTKPATKLKYTEQLPLLRERKNPED